LSFLFRVFLKLYIFLSTGCVRSMPSSVSESDYPLSATRLRQRIGFLTHSNPLVRGNGDFSLGVDLGIVHSQARARTFFPLPPHILLGDSFSSNSPVTLHAASSRLFLYFSILPLNTLVPPVAAPCLFSVSLSFHPIIGFMLW